MASKYTSSHSLPIHSAPAPINVRCYSNSDGILQRSEMTLCANNDIPHSEMLAKSHDKWAQLVVESPQCRAITRNYFMLR
jgi:hypothetical protein